MAFHRNPITREVKTLPTFPSRVEGKGDTLAPASAVLRGNGRSALHIPRLRRWCAGGIIGTFKAKHILVRAARSLGSPNPDKDIRPVHLDESPAPPLHSAL